MYTKWAWEGAVSGSGANVFTAQLTEAVAPLTTFTMTGLEEVFCF